MFFVSYYRFSVICQVRVSLHCSLEVFEPSSWNALQQMPSISRKYIAYTCFQIQICVQNVEPVYGPSTFKTILRRAGISDFLEIVSLIEATSFSNSFEIEQKFL